MQIHGFFTHGLPEPLVKCVVTEAGFKICGLIDTFAGCQYYTDHISVAVDGSMEEVRVSVCGSRDDLIAEKAAVKAYRGAPHRPFPPPPLRHGTTVLQVGS